MKSSVLGALFCATLTFAGQAQTPQPDYSALGREAVVELTTKQFDKVFAQFNQKMAAALPAEKLAEVWTQILRQAGAFQRIKTTTLETRESYHVVTVACAFERAELNIHWSFDSEGHIAGLDFALASESAATEWTAPEYADASKFHEEQVTVTDGHWRLPGMLTLPNGNGPFAAVVLVPGSGPSDEDETIGPNKPFKDLAWGLASRGIAALRYTKRTKQYGAASTDDAESFTVKDEYIDDARAAVALLASRSDIDAKHIFVAGHSEGGYIAPRIAAGDSQIAGIVILEGNTRPMEKLVIEQLHYEANLGGPNAAQIEKLIPQAEEEAKTIDGPDLKPGMDVKLLGATVPASYFLDLRGYDPAAVAGKLEIPIFIVQGVRDYQVTTADFAGWQKALAEHTNAKLKLYPTLNHLLIVGTGPSSPAEYARAGHVSSEVIADVVNWIISLPGFTLERRP
ncbi:MAG: alpha/beta fold hydrolase [Candidatus Acidiferrales bacterium]